MREAHKKPWNGQESCWEHHKFCLIVVDTCKKNESGGRPFLATKFYDSFSRFEKFISHFTAIKLLWSEIKLNLIKEKIKSIEETTNGKFDELIITHHLAEFLFYSSLLVRQKMYNKVSSMLIPSEDESGRICYCWCSRFDHIGWVQSFEYLMLIESS